MEVHANKLFEIEPAEGEAVFGNGYFVASAAGEPLMAAVYYISEEGDVRATLVQGGGDNPIQFDGSSEAYTRYEVSSVGDALNTGVISGEHGIRLWLEEGSLIRLLEDLNDEEGVKIKSALVGDGDSNSKLLLILGKISTTPFRIATVLQGEDLGGIQSCLTCSLVDISLLMKDHNILSWFGLIR